ncbi:MAG: type II toxin-antitoxin system Phd/YefM family antitoxin [Phycisphaerales bacterium]|nr:type II toxin-antitoxin system Phd/YefM family antitoxin [Phycisphaerales bacterium]
MRSEDIRAFTEYRAHLAECHRQVEKTGRPLFVTRDGRPSAVVLSPDAYDKLAEQAQHAADAAAIRRSLEDIKAGRGRLARETLNAIAAKLGVKRKP